MAILEIRQRIAEAETWLTCDCPLCKAMRAGAGVKAIKDHIARLKAELIK